MWINELYEVVAEGAQYTDPRGNTYPGNFPKSEIAGLRQLTLMRPDVLDSQIANLTGYEEVNGEMQEIWSVTDREPVDIAARLAEAKITKAAEIVRWKGEKNNDTFTHLGHAFSSDAVAFKELTGIAGEIGLTGEFSASFPGGWLDIDGAPLAIPTVADFINFYKSMTAQGKANFDRSLVLLSDLNAATTVEQVNAIVW